jgi:hypothetical protein
MHTHTHIYIQWSFRIIIIKGDRGHYMHGTASDTRSRPNNALTRSQRYPPSENTSPPILVTIPLPTGDEPSTDP